VTLKSPYSSIGGELTVGLGGLASLDYVTRSYGYIVWSGWF
jgi:hypothetical protein